MFLYKNNNSRSVATFKRKARTIKYEPYSFSSILYRNKDVADGCERDIYCDNELLFSWDTYLYRLRDIFPGKLSYSWLRKATFDSVST